FAIVERSRANDDRLATGIAYWRSQLADLPKRLNVPTDRPRPALQTFAAGRHKVTMRGGDVSRLRQVGREREMTVNMLLFAAFAVLMARYSGQDDIPIGIISANRLDSQVERLIGFFVNTLVFRARLSPTMTASALLEE